MKQILIFSILALVCIANVDCSPVESTDLSSNVENSDSEATADAYVDGKTDVLDTVCVLNLKSLKTIKHPTVSQICSL